MKLSHIFNDDQIYYKQFFSSSKTYCYVLCLQFNCVYISNTTGILDDIMPVVSTVICILEYEKEVKNTNKSSN